MHLCGHHGKAAPGLTSGCCLDRGIQGQYVGLFGNIRNEFGDFANFLRRLTQPFDPFGCFLNLIADDIHAFDRILHGRVSFFCGLPGTHCHQSRLLGLVRGAIDAFGHLQNRLSGMADFAELLGGGFQQCAGRQFHICGGLYHLVSGCLYVAYQDAPFFHGVVDRVGNCAGDVFRNGCFTGQITVGDGLQFIHQAQNG